MTEPAAPESGNITSLATYIARNIKWNVSEIVTNFTPILGVLVLFSLLTVGGFYSTCLSCNINYVIILTTYIFIISIYLLQLSVSASNDEGGCSACVDMKLLSLYSMFPTLIFIITSTIPLWAGFEILWMRHDYVPRLPINLLARVFCVFLGMITYTIAVLTSRWFLYQRLCQKSSSRNIWTLYL